MQLTKKKLTYHILPYTILFVSVYSILPYPASKLKLIEYLQNTTIWWLILSLILLVFWQSKQEFVRLKEIKNLQVIQWYLLWNIFSIVRGFFVAESYWDWKGLGGNTMALLLPIIAYSATNKKIVQLILSYYVKFALPLFVIFFFLIGNGAFGLYLVPISFLLLFLPAITMRWKIVILFFTLIVLTAGLGARSNIIKFGVPLLLLVVYYFRKVISIKLFEVIRLTLIILPIAFFVFGVSGIFNIFKMNEYMKGDFISTEIDETGRNIKIDIKADTRTFIYVEVLSSAMKHNYWLLGNTPAKGNDTVVFAEWAEGITGKAERLGNEVAIANVFTWTGIVGVILYLFVFFKASYLAVNKSRNIYAKMLGLYIAFRWMFAWVEDINNFSLTYFMLWIMIGLCFSISFRNMTNKEVKIWVRGIFNKHYRKMEYKLYKKRMEWILNK